MSDKIKFLSKITFREYLEIIKHLTFKSVKVIWHICWFSGFFFIAYASYKEYLEKPEDLNIILKSQLITSILLLLYPVYQFYQYYRNYHSKNSIFKENLNIEISNENILAYNDFYSKEINLKKIDKIVKIKDFVLIYFYQDFIILNLQTLEKSAKEKILNILNKKE